MAKNKIWLSPPHMSGEEINFVNEAFASNWIAPLGPHVDAFEQEICQYLQAGHAAALSSGTAAVHLALILLGVSNGDEVICQSMTFSGSANPIVYQQALPIFVDSERETWNMDPELLHSAIEDRTKKGKKPKAVILVHLYGQPAQIDAIQQVCDAFSIPLVEDAAEALGSRYRGRKAGTFGAFSILSFNGNKIITTSGGGMLLSDQADSIQQARHLATQARDDAPHYEHSSIGYNYRMSNLLAAVGRGQLKVIDKRVDKKREIFGAYRERLADTGAVLFQPEAAETLSNKWLTTIVIDPDIAGTDREQVRLALRKENIDARPLWKPMHLQPVFRNAPHYTNGISEELFDRGLCLPSGTTLASGDLDRICEIVRKCII